MEFPTLFPRGEADWLQPQREMSIFMSMQNIFSDIMTTGLEGTLALDTFYLISS
jgi:hypothetical protein